ncbi:hypothetical protein J6590_089770 [Homalodisca vitripennis]|nr:hypothetical protein J6590_089770 [Homalodisca vitripennis]
MTRPHQRKLLAGVQNMRANYPSSLTSDISKVAPRHLTHGVLSICLVMRCNSLMNFNSSILV